MSRRTITLMAWASLLAAAVVGCQPAAEPPPTVTVSVSPDPVIAPTPEAPGCPACAADGPTEPADADSYRRGPWLAPDKRGDKLPDLRVADQAGETHRLADLCDRPTAVSFVYTRCTNPNKCPKVVAEFASLQKLLAAEGLDERVRLLVMTYDPKHDTPAVLKGYGEKLGLRFTPGVRMIRPLDGGEAALFDQLQVAVNYDSAGVNVHGVQLYLFDRKGRVARRYQSVFWENAEVVADLKRLVAEGGSATGR
jgi:cytochrome oxidase Cu insertion factor (SCO1/SenC/PrrC family)